ncbi:MAG: hypothetical protein H0V62_04490 [Gammaproteobacteria bacterium]|nr:hypothetical protein [Gammaproteobacteria bacterium]
MSTLNRFVIPLLSAGLVAACGGGGGDGGSETSVRAPLAINASNGTRLSKEVVAGAEVVNGSGDAVVFSAGRAPGRGEFRGVRTLTYGLVLDQLNAGVSTNAAITTAATVTENCAGGGTQTIVGTDKNNNGIVDAGDTASFTYNNCVDAGVTLNGALGLEVISLQGDPNSTSTNWSFTVGFTFNNLSFRSGAEGFTLNGGYNLAASYTASNGCLPLCYRRLQTEFRKQHGDGAGRQL